jgi:hypothetical protein
MIYIKKNATNNIILELSALAPSAIYWLFEFHPEWSLDAPIRRWTDGDISNKKTRYNHFLLQEASPFDSPAGCNSTGCVGSNGPIFLPPGQWTYKVWGYNTSPPDPNVAPVGPPVSEGRMFVDGFGTNSVYS